MMSFVDQVDLPQNEVTESYLSFNRSVFLFGLASSSGWTAAITCQQTVFQTAEEHYLAESSRSKKSTKPGKPHSRDGRNNDP